MSLADAARTINATAYGYISSWALLTAAEQRVFDRLPAASSDLSDTYPDADLVDTWFHTLAASGLVEHESDGDTWSLTDDMAKLLSGDNSYADYLGGQIMQQMTPRLMSGSAEQNVLAQVLADPESRRGYEGWFADADEAHAYQSSQYAGSLGPAKALAAALPDPTGRVLDLGGGWGAIARAIAKRHGIDVDVVDFATVIDSAPPADSTVTFHDGNALDPSTWPTSTDSVRYDGAVLSYLFSSIPGSEHDRLLGALADRGVRWIAVHDFMVGGGTWAAAWSLQHAVFVPGHTSRSSDEVNAMLQRHGFTPVSTGPLVDEMTTLTVGVRSSTE
ncbi:class I SAM-dependent methyltransferase [Ilumatobacter coccineus]|uniref:Uncharacterized protein n=1 Tax=Ilumatobacter coccineus (strain NBRC 103263 / KCTC 29153 / YM16-304) TaxID=1313172 RepID=A0A6C7E851_ILUCY|nr:methyltransferase domain-containing protein [Ilumatobacter coccineus]BAN02600.1 hypothetical protein YM304_22860 [Ilumatobacter coccineus YM16-304]